MAQQKELTPPHIDLPESHQPRERFTSSVKPHSTPNVLSPATQPHFFPLNNQSLRNVLRDCPDVNEELSTPKPTLINRYESAEEPEEYFERMPIDDAKEELPFKVKIFKDKKPNNKAEYDWTRTTELIVRAKNRKDRVVFFDGKIRQIHSLNLVDETFEALIGFYLTWLATAEEIQAFMQDPKQAAEEIWTPEVRIVNAKGGGHEDLEPRKTRIMMCSSYSWEEPLDKSDCLGWPPLYGVYIRTTYLFQGPILEIFELNAFPFDCQDLRIIIQLRNRNTTLIPLPTREEYLAFNPAGSVMNDLFVRFVSAEFGMSCQDASRGFQSYTQVILSIKTQRQWTSRLDVLIIVYVLGFLTLVVFVMEPAPSTDIGNRVNYLMTLILTDVATQQFVSGSLDDFAYFTAIDKFIFSAFLFKVVCLVAICIPFYPIYHNSVFKNVDLTNQVLAWAFVLAYIALVVFSTIYFIVVCHVEELKLIKSSSSLDKDFMSDDHVTFGILPKIEQIKKANLVQNARTNSVHTNCRLVEFGNKDVHERLTRDRQRLERRPSGQQEEIRTAPIIGDEEMNNDEMLPVHVAGATQVMLFVLTIAASWVVIDAMKVYYSTGIWWEMTAQVVTAYLSCVTICFFSWKFHSDDRKFYYHDLGVSLAFVLQSIVSLIISASNPKKYTSFAFGRSIGMQVFVFITYTCRLINDGLLLYDKSSKECSETRLLSKYIRDKTGKHWIVISAVQGLRVVISSIPVYVIQAAVGHGHVRQKSTQDFEDIIGFICVILALIAISLCYLLGDGQFQWNRKVQMTENERRCCSRWNVGGNLYQAMDDHNDRSIIGWVKSIIARGNWSPYGAVRYPLCASEVWFWLGMCLISSDVFEVDVFGLIAIASPICVGMYHIVVSVPILDAFNDFAFGDDDSYRSWKDKTSALFPFHIFRSKALKGVSTFSIDV